MGFVRKCVLLVIGLALLSMPLHAATLKWGEDFDDQDLDQPSFGTATIYEGASDEAEMGACGEGNDGNYEQTGYGGSGYCLSGCSNVPLFILWIISDAWATEELYVRFYMRYRNFDTGSSQTDHENLKIFYPHWDTDGDDGYVHLTHAVANDSGDDSMYYSARDKDGGLLAQSMWPVCNNWQDGNWHKYEFYVKFDSGIFRFWYDGTLKLDENYTDDCWTNDDIYYITFGSIDAAGGDATWDGRDIDEIVVYDGMPEGGSDPEWEGTRGVAISGCTVN